VFNGSTRTLATPSADGTLGELDKEIATELLD
jgi:hypothetical protein